MFITSAYRWVLSKITTKAQQILLSILSAGPIPRHVAFIMDGNRRYARMKQKEVREGHSDGFVTLKRMLEICLLLDIRCVSAYAFAIENFKRSPGEVDALMTLAEEKLIELCQHGDLLDKYGVRLNILGKTEMLPARVQRVVQAAVTQTRDNNRAIFNLCMPYAAQDEITTAVESCVRENLRQGAQTRITERDIDAQLMTSLVDSPPLDILIRTSGVKRLSDFLLWQCNENTQLQFSSTYWPEFGLFDFIPIILDYQLKVWRQK
ncbi:Di-trans-poly-cis-decaprenylcistransferase [Infundibulicybe gibba]|nr:Di-trans-poly-cis-decaprenylcistransferase [Infundibulicybe gibba]